MSGEMATGRKHGNLQQTSDAADKQVSFNDVFSLR